MAYSFGADVLAKVGDFEITGDYRWTVRLTISLSHRQVAETLATQLAEECLNCEVIGDEFDDEWLCRVERSFVKDETLLSSWADRIEQLASAVGGNVEDWECGVQLGEFCPAELFERLNKETLCAC